MKADAGRSAWAYGRCKPDLNGIWQAMNSANWDIQDHARNRPDRRTGRRVQRAGRPGHRGRERHSDTTLQRWRRRIKTAPTGEARSRGQMLYARRSAGELPAVPLPDRADAHPRADGYEFASASRILYVNGKEEAPVDSWMGTRTPGGMATRSLLTSPASTTPRGSIGREPPQRGAARGRALYAHRPEHHQLRATLEDPKTFTRPWKMNFPLYRRQEKNAQLLEYKCVEFVEELCSLLSCGEPYISSSTNSTHLYSRAERSSPDDDRAKVHLPGPREGLRILELAS